MSLTLSAQEDDGYGFLNIVNLIPGITPVDVTIAGKALTSDGLSAGSDTGWFIVPVGSKSINISLKPSEEAAQKIAKASGNIELIDGLASVVVIFLEPDNRNQTNGEPFPQKIRIQSFPAYNGKGHALRFVSTCQSENHFQIGPNAIDAKPFEIIEISNWSGSDFEIKRNGKLIGKAPGSKEKSSFYLFLGSNSAGEYVTAITSAGTQSLPPWMKKNKKP